MEKVAPSTSRSRKSSTTTSTSSMGRTPRSRRPSRKFTEYIRRAEEICAVLDDGGGGPPVMPNGGDAAVATLPKTKWKDGEDDSEQSNPSSTDSSLALNPYYQDCLICVVDAGLGREGRSNNGVEQRHTAVVADTARLLKGSAVAMAKDEAGKVPNSVPSWTRSRSSWWNSARACSVPSCRTTTVEARCRGSASPPCLHEKDLEQRRSGGSAAAEPDGVAKAWRRADDNYQPKPNQIVRVHGKI